MSFPSTQDAEIARLALAACAPQVPSHDSALVELCVDGSRFVALFDVDVAEHDRRIAAGVGAATNTGLLHALWELPQGLPISRRSISERDLGTFEGLGRGYVEGVEDLTRVYVPAGQVTALIVVKRDLSAAIERISLLPGIYWRVAAAIGLGPPSDDLLAASNRSGIGAAVVRRGEATVVAAPRAPTRGIPAVVRWWLAEIAYRNWGYGNCAHCSS
jgi:hypothetical protein